ncbi:MAG: DUF5103 domain-containing protein [Dysgonamonadaceae bacterium]|jgi:hypothetical protein|nr:DUF5103 domain-containing protein [Dysgonamonadaceae bacterium]
MKTHKHYILKLLCCLSLLLSISFGAQAQKFRTETYSDKVKTLRVNLVDDWQAAPYIELEGDALVAISFDILGTREEIYTYTLTHCNADWTPSSLLQPEFMNGFQNRIIDDYALSVGTSMSYVNYRIEFPNEDVYLKISGNYAVQVFPENSDEPILCACFSVVEKQVDIDMQVTTQTDKGMNNFFQQVGFTLNCGDIVKNPMNDLKVYVLQNERRDNMAPLIKPLHIQNNKLTYQHIPEMIFEAGNEYRKFEMTSRHFNGLNIESMQFYSPYYHVTLKPDIVRSELSYSYYEDINGRIYIRTLDGTDFDTEADYYFVHFFLPAQKPFTENVYILSQAFNNLLDEQSRMEYSQSDGGYIKTAIMKEGYYNYLFVTKRNTNSPASLATIEGNFYQTENEYRVLVYFRRAGDRFDRLIGTQTIQFF